MSHAAFVGPVVEALEKKLSEIARLGEPYLSIDQVCAKFGISRPTFYKMLPGLFEDRVAVRVPPPDGPVRVASERLVRWLRAHGKEA